MPIETFSHQSGKCLRISVPIHWISWDENATFSALVTFLVYSIPITVSYIKKN